MRELELDQVRFDRDGLVPVVVQEQSTKQVLMLGYASRETLEETLSSGLLTFFSRSRNARWLKGETSGNYLRVNALSLDCDGDTVLALVSADGPACHNGTETCFEEPM
ncbi:MAG: phosphoribosyl-AMP cyclohydrolase [Aquiluna sp.]